MQPKTEYLNYEGCNFYRLRFILSCISGKPIRIKNIREKDLVPGVKDFEVSFIRLVDRICNGGKVLVNDTGTEVKFQPGILNGGRIEHTCPSSRSIGYFLEPLILIAPFCKEPLNITLKGVTNNNEDPSVDMIRYSLVPVLKKFLINDEGLSLKLVRRGLPPHGGGIVEFTCPLRRTLKAFQWEEMGKIQKIRGVAYTSRVAPTVANRMMEEAKSVFKKFLADIYFTCDNSKGSSPGYGMCITAETNRGSHLSAEVLKNTDDSSEVPEDLGRKAAFALLEEIHNGGCVDSVSQPLVLTFMVLAPKDVSKVVMGPLTPYTMNFMKHLRDFFGVTFKIDAYRDKTLDFEEDQEMRTGAQKLLLTCVGTGYTNVSKPQL